MYSPAVRRELNWLSTLTSISRGGGGGSKFCEILDLYVYLYKHELEYGHYTLSLASDLFTANRLCVYIFRL